MKPLGILMCAIGYGGNSLLFLYIEYSGIARQPWNLVNPLYHLEVIIAVLTQPLFWVLLVVSLLGMGAMSAAETPAER